MYGPPGTGKTLIARYSILLFVLRSRALACNVQAKFLKVVASGIVDKYIGESARVIREMFGKFKSIFIIFPSLCQRKSALYHFYG